MRTDDNVFDTTLKNGRNGTDIVLKCDPKERNQRHPSKKRNRSQCLCRSRKRNEHGKNDQQSGRESLTSTLSWAYCSSRERQLLPHTQGRTIPQRRAYAEICDRE